MSARAFTSQRAFATTSALFMVVLVSAAVTAVTAVLVTDVRRTGVERGDAQLRQMLTAGVLDLCGRANSGHRPTSGDSWSVALPAELAGSVRVVVDSAAADGPLGARITATLDERSMSQHIELEQGERGVRVRRVELIDPPR